MLGEWSTIRSGCALVTPAASLLSVVSMSNSTAGTYIHELPSDASLKLLVQSHNVQGFALSTHLNSDVKALVLVGLRGQDVVLGPPFHLWPQVPHSIVDDVAGL